MPSCDTLIYEAMRLFQHTDQEKKEISLFPSIVPSLFGARACMFWKVPNVLQLGLRSNERRRDDESQVSPSEGKAARKWKKVFRANGEPLPLPIPMQPVVFTSSEGSPKQTA